MKKIFLLLMILITSGCSFKEQDNLEDSNGIDEGKQALEYVDDNEVKLSLFLYDNNYSNKKRLEDAYYTDFISGVDIGSFEVFLTDDQIINGTDFKSTWNKYYNNYSDIENHKVGFNIKFVLNDGTSYGDNFLEPDIYRFGEYFYVYLYDDIHQKDGAFYGHLESMEEDTLLTSIKIYATDGISNVDSFILSAFTYNSEDDFDSEGNYRGNSLYVIRIKRNS